MTPLVLAKLLVHRVVAEDVSKANEALDALEGQLSGYTYSWVTPSFEVTTNVSRLAWLCLALSNDPCPSFVEQRDLDAYVAFFQRVRAAELENDYEGSRDELGPRLFAMSRETISIATTGDSSPQSVEVGSLFQFPPYAYASAPSRLTDLSKLEMTTDFECDPRSTPHLDGPNLAGGYQDRRFRAGEPERMVLYRAPLASRSGLHWLGDASTIPEAARTYYIHPEAAEIHARFGYDVRDLEPTTVHKTSSPRSFYLDSDSGSPIGLKVTLPRFFSGVLRVIDRTQIDVALSIGRHCTARLPSFRHRRIEFWPELAACLPEENAHFGMLFRTIRLAEDTAYTPWFAVADLSMTKDERTELLCELLIEVVSLAFDQGILLECHAQNILLAKHRASGKTHFVFRDNGGIFLAPDGLERGSSDHGLLTAYMSGVPALMFDRLWRLFCGSCAFSLSRRDGLSFVDLDAFYNHLFMATRERLRHICPEIMQVSSMREACERIDHAFRARFCTTSSFHRIG